MDGDSFISHLEALRNTLIKCLSALGVFYVPMFFAAPYLIETLIAISSGANHISYNYFSPMEVFMLQIKTAAVIDLLFCFPYIAKCIWDFILPALYDVEKKFIRSITLFSSLLFLCGVLAGLFLALPLMIEFGLSFSEPLIRPIWGVAALLNLALTFSVIFGLMFQFPLVTFALIRTGFVSPDSVKNKRPYIFVAILLISALLTPPDVISQLMLALPTYLLFEIGLFMGGKAQNVHSTKNMENVSLTDD